MGQLAERSLQFSSWRLCEAVGEGLALLVEHRAKPEDLLRLIGASDVAVSGEAVEARGEGVVRLLSDLSKSAPQLAAAFTIESDAKKYVDLMSTQAVTGAPEVRPLLKPRCAPEGVIEVLVALVAGADDVWARTVKNIAGVNAAWPWGKLTEAVSRALTPAAATPVGSALTRALLSLHRVAAEEARAALNQARASGGLFHVLAALGSGVSGAGDVVAAILISDANPDSPPGNLGSQANQGREAFRRWLSNSSAGPADKAVAKAVVNAGAQADVLSNRAAAAVAGDAIDRVLREIAGLDRSWPAPEALAGRWEEFAEILGAQITQQRLTRNYSEIVDAASAMPLLVARQVGRFL